MTSNALATGRRTYLHESAALDFAIRACEALGLVFWALAPGTDIWATDYSQNTFRVNVSPAKNGTRKVSFNDHVARERKCADVAVGERRTVAQADEWSLFSIEDEAQDTAEHDVKIALEPVLGTDSSVYVARCACGAEFDSISWDDAGYWADRHDARRVADETAETVAPVADTAIEAPVVETAPATPVVIEVDSIEGHTATYSGAYADGFTATCTCGWTMAGYALPTNARVAAREHVGDAAQDTAPVVPAEHSTAVVAESGKGGRVWRAHCTCGHRSATYVAEHAAQGMAEAHEKETAPNTRVAIEAVATARGWTIEASVAGDRHAELSRLGVSIDLEYTVGGTVKRASVYGQAFGTFGYSDRIAEVTPRETGKRETVLAWLAAPVGATRAESRDLMRDHVIGAPVEDTADVAPEHAATVVTLAPHRFQPTCVCGWKGATAILERTAEYSAATHVASAERAPYAAGDPVTVRGESIDGIEAHGTVTGYDGNVSVSLENGSSVYVDASDVTPRVSDAAAEELRAHRAASSNDDVTPRVMGITGTGVAIRDRESGKEYGFHAACWAVFSDAVGPTARLVEVGPLFGGDWTCTQCVDAPSNRWATDGNRAYATMVGDFGHALATLTPYRDRYELAIEYAATGNRDVFPVHAGDVHAAIAEAERRVAREAVDASSNDVPAETEFAARVRTAQAPKVPGIHVARCYRCGETASETLRLPVSSLTNVCREHVAEARAVAMRWDEASRYMHEEAPGTLASNGQLAVIFTREATNRLDVPLPVIARAVLDADARSQHGVGLTDRAHRGDDRDAILARDLDAFTAARGTAPSNPVVGK